MDIEKNISGNGICWLYFQSPTKVFLGLCFVFHERMGKMILFCESVKATIKGTKSNETSWRKYLTRRRRSLCSARSPEELLRSFSGTYWCLACCVCCLTQSWQEREHFQAHFATRETKSCRDSEPSLVTQEVSNRWSWTSSPGLCPEGPLWAMLRCCPSGQQTHEHDMGPVTLRPTADDDGITGDAETLLSQ